MPFYNEPAMAQLSAIRGGMPAGAVKINANENPLGPCDAALEAIYAVAKNGIAGNWLWWNMVMSGMLTVFFYARLWRRAGVMTDIEFAELRYSGKPAACLRGFRALYLGIPVNCIILGWVNLAMIKIIKGTLGVDLFAAVLILIGILLVSFPEGLGP